MAIYDGPVIVHFAVEGPNGTPSHRPADAAALEDALKTHIGRPGTTWVAACDEKGVAGRMASGEAWAVNCPACQKDDRWQAVPDTGPHKKRPVS